MEGPGLAIISGELVDGLIKLIGFFCVDFSAYQPLIKKPAQPCNLASGLHLSSAFILKSISFN